MTGQKMAANATQFASFREPFSTQKHVTNSQSIRISSKDKGMQSKQASLQIIQKQSIEKFYLQLLCLAII